MTYSLPLYKRLNVWVKGEVRNMFNSTPLISYQHHGERRTTNSPKDALGIPTGYIKGANFGKGTGTANYPFPREYFLTAGIRF